MNEWDTQYKVIFERLLQLLAILKETYNSGHKPIQWKLTPETEEFMEWIYTLGLALHKHPELSQIPDFMQYIQESAVLLADIEYDTWIDAFCADIDDQAQKHDSEVDFYRWYEIPWMLSAIEFFIDLYKDAASRHCALFLRESIENYRIEHIHAVMGGFPDKQIPEGIPFYHWWWWQDGKTINRSTRQPYIKPSSAAHGNPSNPEHL